MPKEISNNDLLKAIKEIRTDNHDIKKTLKENQAAIKENQAAIKENQAAIKENQAAIKENQAAITEVLEAINIFSNETDNRFTKIEAKTASIESRMVTKDYLDDKLADLRGDLVVLTRKEDTKVRKLVEILNKHKLITEKEAKEVMSMEPFPQLSL